MNRRTDPPSLLGGLQRELVDASRRRSSGEHRRLIRIHLAAMVVTIVVLFTPPSSAAVTASVSQASAISQTLMSGV